MIYITRNFAKTKRGLMNRKDVSKLFKRFLITFACSLPLLILVGIFIEGKVSDFVMVTIFVVLAGIVLALEELLYRKFASKRQQKVNESKDGSHFGEEVAREDKLREEKLEKKKAKKEAKKKNK